MSNVRSVVFTQLGSADCLVIMSVCYLAIMLLCYFVIMLFCHFIMLVCYYATLLLCYYVISYHVIVLLCDMCLL